MAPGWHTSTAPPPTWCKAPAVSLPGPRTISPILQHDLCSHPVSCSLLLAATWLPSLPGHAGLTSHLADFYGCLILLLSKVSVTLYPVLHFYTHTCPKQEMNSRLCFSVTVCEEDERGSPARVQECDRRRSKYGDVAPLRGALTDQVER